MQYAVPSDDAKESDERTPMEEFVAEVIIAQKVIWKTARLCDCSRRNRW